MIRETWIRITCLRPSFAGMRKWSLHGSIHGVSQTGNSGTCRFVKHSNKSVGVHDYSMIILVARHEIHAFHICGQQCYRTQSFKRYSSRVSPASSISLFLSSSVIFDVLPSTCLSVSSRSYCGAVQNIMVDFIRLMTN